ncbi:MAG: sigma-54 dependent transcriptional regulator [Bdellovibrionota bacterium]
MPNLLIVDDEASILQLFQMALQKKENTVTTANSAQEALEKMKTEFFDLIVTDLSMPGMDGMELLKKTKEVSPETSVIMMTAYGSTQTAVDAMKAGAYDYLTKPIQLEDLKKTIQNAMTKAELQRENEALKKVTTKQSYDNQLTGESKAFQKVVQWIDQVAKTNSSVLILGESGTGKELVAREVHNRSDRSNQPFVAVNCAAIPQHLMESELFGYAKGAFTGAEQHRIGFFEAAHRGTIFLDEIGELPLNLQSKLLRVLAEKKVVRVGSTREIRVDFRIIAATNQSLEQLVKRGEFREDLYYRLNVLQTELPPLRERKEDIEVLANHFLKKFSEEYRKKTQGFDDKTMEILSNYPFPGNIRELINIVEQCIVLANGEMIMVETLPEKMRNPLSAGASKVLESDTDLEKQVEAFEKDLILRALEQAGGNKTQAAKLLNISFRSLRYRLEKLGMDDGKDE